MALIKTAPLPGLVIKIICSLLFLLFFENVCLGSQWTMMFYMAADNDLYSQALTDIEELKKISVRPGIEILVQLDSPSGAFRYKVLPQGTSTLASLGQINSGSPEALADFGIWAVKSFPAQKYLLVLWDHGDGWSKHFKYIGYDQNFNDYLGVAGGEFRQALVEISSVLGKPLDVVVFDACSMQMAEVLSELIGLCRYSVGSEALFPVEGMPYDIAWKDIDGNTSPESLAVRLVNSCDIYEALGYQTTCSAVDIERLSQAAEGMTSLVGPFRQLPAASMVNPEAISDSTLSFPPVSSYDLPEMLDFIGHRLPEPEKTKFLEISRQFKNTILAQTVTGGTYQNANGLSAWYPAGKYNYENGIDSYPSLKWSGLSGWDKILFQIIFGRDSFALVPQNIALIKGPDGSKKMTWEPGYEPSGIKSYLVRRSKSLIDTYSDRGGGEDSSNWSKTGFTIGPFGSGDTAYCSLGGQMTGRNEILFDSAGSLGFSAKGIWGSLVIESSEDTCLGWDTLGRWNFYGEGPLKYCSAKVKTAQARIRISWSPFSSGWVCVDDIRVFYPDTADEIEFTVSQTSYYDFPGQTGKEGYYQVRTIDSLDNQSPWSEALLYKPEASIISAWPNPFKAGIFLKCSLPAGTEPEVKIYNISGQYVDRMSLEQKTTDQWGSERLYRWDPGSTLASGVYIARICTDRGSRAVKMILIR